MIEGTALDIARFLVEKARVGSRTTYEGVASEIGWGHPTGRGLGKHLYEVMRHCKEQSLPPLALIVVKKGTKIPSPEALPHISAALGEIDVEAKQKRLSYSTGLQSPSSRRRVCSFQTVAVSG